MKVLNMRVYLVIKGRREINSSFPQIKRHLEILFTLELPFRSHNGVSSVQTFLFYFVLLLGFILFYFFVYLILTFMPVLKSLF